MNKHAVQIAIVVIALVGGGWFFVLHEQAQAPASIEDEPRPGSSGSVTRNQSATVSETFAGTGSFEDLVGLGRDIACDFSYVADTTNAAVAGTIKVSGANFRSDFEMHQAGETYDSHLIQSGQYTYSWTKSEAGVVAVLMDMNELAEAERPVIMDSDVDYSCRAWDADISAFVPPNDIEFVNYEELMGNPNSAAETL